MKNYVLVEFVKNWILPYFKALLPKNAFCVKLAQGMQLGPESCVLLDFLLKSGGCQNLRFFAKSCVSRQIFTKNKYMLFTGREVRMGKNCARGLETKTKGPVFSHTDRPRPVNNLFIFSVCLLFFRWDVCKSVSLRLEEESGNKIL